MRKMILTLLLATSVAMPAMAQDDRERRRDRGANNATSEAMSAERAARQAERQTARAAAVAARSERGEGQRQQGGEGQRQQGGDRDELNARREARQQAMQQRGEEQQVVRQRVADQQDGERREWGQRRFNDERNVRNRAFAQQREYRGEGRSRDGSLMGRALEQSYSRNGQFVVRPGNDSRYQPRRPGTNRQWSGQWRNDRNYNWRNYRDRNHSIFRRGYYRDPYGSSYRRFSIGFNLFPSYYQSNYWLNDPWQYRLPPAYGPYRWVRYYDDALLVNIYSGQVVDVVHSFFW